MELYSIEIPAARWFDALDQFSRRHHGQVAQMVTVSPDSGVHPQSRELPLMGITAEPAEGGPHIEVVAASPDGTHVSHEIEHPTKLRLSEWNDGVSAQLEIEAENGYLTRVRVGPAEQILPPGVITDGFYQRP